MDNNFTCLKPGSIVGESWAKNGVKQQATISLLRSDFIDFCNVARSETFGGN